MTHRLPILFLAVLFSGCGSQGVDFNSEIRPILNERCVTCHGGVKTQADLNLQFRNLALVGGESGNPAIVPGDASASEMIRKVSHSNPSDRMPKDDDPLTEEEITSLKKWINSGAEWERHWAYVAPVKPELELEDAWIRSPIDAFILDRLRENGLEPEGPAECSVLARRVSLDLTGLPPSMRQADDLCASNDYEALVDELLASPSFGERWTALWLDLSRYADTKGYEADRQRSIWRYRDWLIKAFNEDKPFDEFTIEQLAGDLLEDPTTDQLIATAFNRNSMTNEEGGTDDEEHRVASVVDRVSTTWEVFQGTTMRCVQCHGHPYDPFVHDDFYASFALFNNTADWDQPNEAPVLREFEPAHEQDGTRLLAEISTLESDIVAAVSTPEIMQLRSIWEQSMDDPMISGKLTTTAQNEVRRIAALPDSLRSNHQKAFIRDRFAEVDASTDSLRKRLGELFALVNELKPVITPVMQELSEDEARTTHRFDRGSFLSPQEVVSPGIPKMFGSPQEGAPSTRLEFAEWLVSDENPLTARVTVNRFWEQLFGLGIVESADDFGTVGIAPTHPELLDWLALYFKDEANWSVKTLLREIVLSSTYRQASTTSSEKLEIDPRNQLLSRGPRFRLSAEQVRDQALAVSGLLSEKQFGPSVMPPQPDGVWKNPYNGLNWKEAEGEDKHRRAIYTFYRRTGPYPSMLTFDAPTREFCISRRVRTNTPLQALVTLNDPAFWEAAQGLAKLMAQHDPAVEEQVSFGYKRAMSSEPSENTLRVLIDLAEDAGLELTANAILNLDEFLTKE